MVNEKKENSGNLKELATGLVQTARQNVESTVEKLRGAASNALEKMADRKSLPRRRKRARSPKNSSGRAGKRRQAAAAGNAKKR